MTGLLENPTAQVVVGAQTIAFQNILSLNIHLGCTKEVNSFEVVVDNSNPDYYKGQYSPNGAKEFIKGSAVTIKVKRGSITGSTKTQITGKLESIEYIDQAEEYLFRDVVVLRGRCKGRSLFSRKFNGDLIASAGSDKAEDLIAYLIENYTDLSHVRNSTDLIEESNTSFTEFLCDHETIYDIIKFISDVASTAQGIIGYDAIIEYDGKFAWRAKGKNTESYTLEEEVNLERFLDDSSRIKNKIWVYGKPDKPYPLQSDGLNYSDIWTESISSKKGQISYYMNADSSEVYFESDLYMPGGVVPGDVVYLQDLDHYPEFMTVSSYTQNCVSLLTEDAYTDDDHVHVADPESYTVGEKIKLVDTGGSSFPYTITSKGTGVIYLSPTVSRDFLMENNARVERPHRIIFTGSTVYIHDNVYGVVFKVEANGGWGYIPYDAWNRFLITQETSAPIYEGNKSIDVLFTASYSFCQILLILKTPIDFNAYPKLSFFLYFGAIAPRTATIKLMSGGLTVTELATLTFKDFEADEWKAYNFEAGKTNQNQWNMINGSSFDWTNVKVIALYFEWESAQAYQFWIDRMFIGGKRWGGGSNNAAVDGFAENEASQEQYDIQEHVVVNDSLLSEAECEAKAQSLLAYLMSPSLTFELETSSLDLGDGVVTPGNKVPVNMVPINKSDSYRIDSVDIDLNSSENTLRYFFTLENTPLKSADYLYTLARKLRMLEKDYGSIR